MDDQEDADMEQRLINEGMLRREIPSLMANLLILPRVQDVEEEQPLPL